MIRALGVVAAVGVAGAHGFLVGRRHVFPAPLIDGVLERRRRRPWGPWSVAATRVADPLDLADAVDTARPVLTWRDVHDVDAVFVADPFVVRDGEAYHLFVEVMERATGHGVIASASSRDGLDWTYDGVVLREPFHLSYPQVFSWRDRHYMVPETNETRTVRLYATDRLPGGWRHEATLLRGHRFVDASLFEHGDRWWMLVSDAGDPVLNLYVADAPTGPWIEHPANPVVAGDARRARPGGRVLVDDGRIVRFAQDDTDSYGRALSAFEVTELTPERFCERELDAAPLLGPGRSAWNRAGMHHLDLLRDDHGWLAVVDGREF
jgi:hypothetical protein